MAEVAGPGGRALLAQAHRYDEDVVALVQDLVQIPSVNGRENESAVAQRILSEARRLGFGADLTAAEKLRPNVVVTWGSGEDAFALIGHMDTVAEGDHAVWTHPPFSAAVVGGKLFGRGAADNKAGIACALYAMVLIRDEKLLDGALARVVLAGVADEESGASSPLGVRYLLDTGLLRAKGAIYTYAGDTICTGHRGLLRLILSVEGQAIHSGSAEWSHGVGGANAVAGLSAILARLESLHVEGPFHEDFAAMGNTITPTLIQGGEFESMVPAHAEALIDVRMVPGQDSAELIAAVQTIADDEVAKRPGLRASIAVKNRLPGAAIPRGHPLARIALEHARSIASRPLNLGGAGPANEGYMLIEAGIPTLPGFGPQGGNAHAPDEWVSIDSLPEAVAMYAATIRDYLLAQSTQ